MVAETAQAKRLALDAIDTADTDTALLHQTERHLKRLLSGHLKLSIDRLDVQAPLEQYGIDSVMVMELTGGLERSFGSLSKTLFYEHQSIQALAKYFVQNHRTVLTAKLGLLERAQHTQRTQPPKPAPVRASAAAADLPVRRLRRSPAAPAAMDIAIVSMSGRFPKSPDLQAYWRNLAQRVDCIVEVPSERWDAGRYFDQEKGKLGKSYSKWGSFIEGAEEFDPLFFGIAPHDARLMDPQARLLLETVWNLLETRGYTKEALRQRHDRRIGVYVGAMYQQHRPDAHNPDRDSLSLLSSYSALANRVSQQFGFEGPSLAVDTMCSSSAQAVHLACQALLSGECGLAVAAGVNLSTDPAKYVGLSLAELLCGDPHQRSFGEGEGYHPGEGVGAVLLKPLADAQADGDTVLAVIKGSASNHSGQSNGYMTPNPHTQAQVMRDGLRRANVSPDSIGYVEASATGARLADAIEIVALSKVFEGVQHKCALGTLKSTMGHLEAASGVAQIIKVVLQLQQGQIAPVIEPERLNESLQVEGLPLRLQTELGPWAGRPENGAQPPAPRRALINSFGAGGTCVSLVIEEAAPQKSEPPVPREEGPQLILLSARTPEQLDVVARLLLDHLERHPDESLEDVAYTLQVGREAHESRLALVVRHREQVLDDLRACMALERDERSEVVGLYSGNASEGQAHLQRLLSSDVLQSAVLSALEEGDLHKLARYWVSGARIAWAELPRSWQPRKLALPTYPFHRSPFVMPGNGHEAAVVAEGREVTPMASGITSVASGPGAEAGVRDVMTAWLSQTLGLVSDDMSLNKSMSEYGLDSVRAMRLLRHLETAFSIELKSRDFIEHHTFDAFASYLERKLRAQRTSVESEQHGSAPLARPPSAIDDTALEEMLQTFKDGAIDIAVAKAVLEQYESL
ncbi:MAG: beta-ketoacyl synthase N-terminal-like domain-containing protein [Rhizobacter sp.]